MSRRTVIQSFQNLVWVMHNMIIVSDLGENPITAYLLLYVDTVSESCTFFYIPKTTCHVLMSVPIFHFLRSQLKSCSALILKRLQTIQMSVQPFHSCSKVFANNIRYCFCTFARIQSDNSAFYFEAKFRLTPMWTNQIRNNCPCVCWCKWLRLPSAESLFQRTTLSVRMLNPMCHVSFYFYHEIGSFIHTSLHGWWESQLTAVV